jgi:transcriptional antiterminator RfaH
MEAQTLIWNETNWFAIQTKPCQESLASLRVAKLEIEVFLPQVKRPKLVCGVSRLVIQPLFQGYFFARFIPSVFIDVVRFSWGVLRIVGTREFPVPVDAQIISDIQERVQPNGLIRLEASSLKAGDMVRIEQGPFGGFMGKVEREVDDGRRVAILLEAIHSARLLVERDWLAAVDNI